MSAEAITLAVVETLEALGVPYMLVGSFSSNLYGIPRSTKDADFVVQLDNVSISSVRDRLGPGFELDPQMTFETITATSRYRLQHRNSVFQIELFLLSDDAHDRERFARRRRVPLQGHDVFVPSPEDVIVTKLRWSKQGARAKDIDDVRDVLSVQGDGLDWDYLRRWCAAHGTTQLLERVRQETEAG
jgi:hypothetical protein